MSTATSNSRSYADAIGRLNTLQSNFSILAAIRASGKARNAQAIPEMLTWAARIGYTPSTLNSLNILHIAGTKGKGSTSAFAASILNRYRRSSSFPSKVGLYTSPHLRAVRERIQINGAPLSEPVFAKYFFQVWDRLEESAAREGRDAKEKPVYFRFLTLMAFHVFSTEGVDSAVFEVGVGGEYDSTNIIEKPTVCGISALGIDHTGVLGNTLEEIAWHKAGIIKAGAEVLSSPQKASAMEVLQKRASEKGVQCRVVNVHPSIQTGEVNLGLGGEFQKQNAALAVEMVSAHLKKLGHHDITISPPSAPLPAEITAGLETVVWPGRCQVIREDKMTWYIDGAHTQESLHAAGIWFASQLTSQKRVLIFNQQNRDLPADLLRGLASSLRSHLGAEFKPLFEHAVFCTNVTFREQGYSADLVSVGSDKGAVEKLSVQRELEAAWKELEEASSSRTSVVATIEDAVEIARAEGEETVVTGSLHLVGGLLEVLNWNQDIVEIESA